VVPKAFVAEVYRRMNVVGKPQPAAEKPRTVDEYFESQPFLWHSLNLNYHHRLPKNLGAAILDIGCGPGHFLAACTKWGYTNLSAMDYVLDMDQFRLWGIHEFHQVSCDLPTSLGKQKGRFDFIHAAHLIEHIPKYDLLENVDAMFYALRPGGLLVLETPNMLAPSAMASLFVTLGHEYGFTQSNLCSLLNICGFQKGTAEPVLLPSGRLKWRLRNALRAIFLCAYRLRFRLFAFKDTIVTGNIIVSGIRPDVDPLPERVSRTETKIS